MELLFNDDGIKLYLGNANNMADVGDGTVDLIVTSPPYFNAREVYSVWPTYQEYLDDMMLVWKECYRVMAPRGRACINITPEYGYGADYYNMYLDIGNQLEGLMNLWATVIWDKYASGSADTAWGSFASASRPHIRGRHEVILFCAKDDEVKLGDKGESTISSEDFVLWTQSVWRFPGESRHKWHPAPFPPELPKRCIHLLTYKDGLVLDPFAGSGTTLMVARELGRQAIGIEMKRGYAESTADDLRLGRKAGDVLREAKAQGFDQTSIMDFLE